MGEAPFMLLELTSVALPTSFSIKGSSLVANARTLVGEDPAMDVTLAAIMPSSLKSRLWATNESAKFAKAKNESKRN